MGTVVGRIQIDCELQVAISLVSPERLAESRNARTCPALVAICVNVPRFLEPSWNRLNR
jgi:hypothetical protein